MNDIDFEQRDWVPYSGWPITRADLEDYYQKASEVLKLPDYRYFFNPRLGAIRHAISVRLFR
jgi:hypothetical protein